MAISTQSSSADAGFSAQRRWSIGLNVAVSVVAAILLVGLVNWLATLRQVRRDVSLYGGYGVSDRTRSIVDGATGDIAISVMYSPDEASKAPTQYIDRLMDYLDELRRINPSIKVEDVRAHNARAKLVARLSETLGGEAEQHRAALQTFRATATEVQQALAQQMDRSRQIQVAGEAWLQDFPIYSDVIALLKQNVDRLAKTVEQVEQFTAVTSGVPKFGEAAERIKSDVGQLKTELGTVGEQMRLLSDLADALGKPDSDALAPLTEIASKLPPQVAKLKQIIGDRNSPMPSDPKAVLKQFADEGEAADKEIQNAVRQAENLARRYKAITEHSLWSVQASLGGALVMRLPLTRQLSELGRTFGDLRLQILGIIDKGDPGSMERAIRKLRDFSEQFDDTCQKAARSLGDLAQRIVKVDPLSRAVLDESRAGFLKAQLDALDKVLAEFNSLPELKLGTIADDIKDDNVVVVEANKKVRVIKFDEMWPIRVVINDPMSSSGEDKPRVFNGDAVLGGTILALTRERPFATVVFVHYANKDQQQQQFMRPQPPAIQTEELSAFRKRLDEANFKVKEWDLASPEGPPEPEEGTTNLYIVLPPAPPPQPNPFMGGAPPKGFGDEERSRLAKALAGDSRAVFLATWDVRPGGPFGGSFMSPRYALDDYLRETWGVTIDGSYRVTWIEPDPRDPNRMSVNADRFQFMPLNSFTQHPIGRPFQTNPVKLFDACPLTIATSQPANVSVEPILVVPGRSEEYVGADVQDLIQIINEVMNPSADGVVPRSSRLLKPPFVLMAAARNDATKSAAVIFGGGRSVSDAIISRPVPRQDKSGRIVAEPPPVTNAELLMNSLFWLLGQDKLIASGPPAAPTIRTIDADWMNFLRVLSYGLWPAAVFAPGLFIFFARRR